MYVDHYVGGFPGRYLGAEIEVMMMKYLGWGYYHFYFLLSKHLISLI
jgi:hypothetical protein